MPKTELERRFAKAVWLIRNGPPKEGTSNDEKLQFYGYFKQATEGDCTAPQPWAVQVRAGGALQALDRGHGRSGGAAESGPNTRSCRAAARRRRPTAGGAAAHIPAHLPRAV